jgi:segregation and condensation protein A
VSLASLELDLDLFSGPFDLLLTLVLREEVDLLELQLAEVVLAYLDHLEARGELDLETATEFIVLIAALLELKSKLMLSDEEELLDIEPEQAAEELLARMLDARRYRAAATHLSEMLAREHGVRFREVPLPASLRRTIIPAADGSQNPEVLGAAIGRLLAMPPSINVRHISVPRVTVAARLEHLRGLLRRSGAFSFEEAVRGADRVTIAVTLFALLELYKRGEAGWVQEQSFGEIEVSPLVAAAPVHTLPDGQPLQGPSILRASRAGVSRGIREDVGSGDGETRRDTSELVFAGSGGGAS